MIVIFKEQGRTKNYFHSVVFPGVIVQDAVQQRIEYLNGNPVGAALCLDLFC